MEGGFCKSRSIRTFLLPNEATTTTLAQSLASREKGLFCILLLLVGGVAVRRSLLLRSSNSAGNLILQTLRVLGCFGSTTFNIRRSKEQARGIDARIHILWKKKRANAFWNVHSFWPFLQSRYTTREKSIVFVFQCTFAYKRYFLQQ